MPNDLFENPYTEQTRREFWEICVKRDLEAFLAQDWSMTACDFCADDFFGLDAQNQASPAQWRPKYATLEAYRQDFDLQAEEFATKEFAEDPREAMYRALTITDPQIEGERALVTKIFKGQLKEKNGDITLLDWQSVFQFKRKGGRWLITGFVGYMPND